MLQAITLFLIRQQRRKAKQQMGKGWDLRLSLELDRLLIVEEALTSEHFLKKEASR